MNRFQTIAYIGKGTGNDDRHGIVNVALLHLIDKV